MAKISSVGVSVDLFWNNPFYKKNYKMSNACGFAQGMVETKDRCIKHTIRYKIYITRNENIMHIILP
jgi:hypothetical protein